MAKIAKNIFTRIQDYEEQIASLEERLLKLEERMNQLINLNLRCHPESLTIYSSSRFQLI